MALLSGGELVLAESQPSFGTRTTSLPSTGLNLTGLFTSYGAIYRKQPWVYTVVRKKAKATARLPFKVYRRDLKDGRVDARDSDFGKLIRRPNPRHDPFFFWEWTSSTFNVYGEAIWLKIRDRNGVPAELWPIHPSNISVEIRDRSVVYLYLPGGSSSQPLYAIPEADVVHFKSYNPDSTTRGLSPLEPLRLTLLNEDAALRANTGFWNNGARPAVYLSHPKTLSEPAMARLKANWDAVHGGVDNFGKTAILEEGMEPKGLSVNAEDSQYVETRRLSREEVCGVYDVPPPAVHILDHATFSNITEQMRSLYRDTMAPDLGAFEATVELQLRPDFGEEDIYGEFLMDEVLRGSFEARQDAYAKADYMTVAEKRRNENLPFIEGTDCILVNGAYVPLDAAAVNALGTLVRAGFDPEAALEALGLPPIEHTGLFPVTVQGEGALEPVPPASARALDAMWGRLGSYSSLDEINPDVITAGLNGEAAVVRSALADAYAAGDSISDFRARLRAALA